MCLSDFHQPETMMPAETLKHTAVKTGFDTPINIVYNPQFHSKWDTDLLQYMKLRMPAADLQTCTIFLILVLLANGMNLYLPLQLQY